MTITDLGMLQHTVERAGNDMSNATNRGPSAATVARRIAAAERGAGSRSNGYHQPEWSHAAGPNTAFVSETHQPMGESQTVDEPRRTATRRAPSFGSVLAQYLSNHWQTSSSGDVLRTSPRNNSIQQVPDWIRHEDGHRHDNPQTESPGWATLHLGQTPASLQDPSYGDSSHSSPQGWQSACLESVLRRTYLPRTRTTPPDPLLRREELDHSPGSSTSYRRAQRSLEQQPLSAPPTSGAPSQLFLTELEVVLFRNFVERVARWIDAFSPENPFATHVPVLALQCPAILLSCLAISAKQMALVATEGQAPIQDVLALQYYQRALRAISSLLTKPEHARSDEILASCIMLSK
ncbi:hypothetical protein A1O1_01004 [Capronia coronata CBS 617.96]|uniref:Transcription factor domain-containing protein n=1 Tax=Capronia coronata CBS 617.96 TaxID=1182541 RepID=W9ZN46_9EURO|nr:uncharacterized protein A1O1_01004 [Capronia coronata CBS 617.96]EXJ95879.1 hypothetical protein A1O1_01004 [Capronia coronata CBS 617.96]